MGFTSLQVCMDSADWFQGAIEEESGMDSSTSPSGEILTCGSRPLMERRLRPQPDQALKCPRCDSTHTKFCYYNNYSLSQPRYFCKTCRRYWTKGGTLRNIPVGGGCRKNNKKLSKKPNPTASAADPPPPSLIPPHQYYSMNPSSLSSSHNNISSSSTDLHLSFNNHLPHEVHLSHHHLNGAILGAQGTLAAAATASASFMDNKFGIGMLENHPPHLHSAPRPIDFMESKLEAIVEGSRNYDFMGNGEFGSDHHLGNNHGLALAPNFHGFCSPYNGVSLSSLDGNGTGTFMETCQRLMHTYENNGDQNNHIDVKPNAKLLSLEWQDQGCSDNGKDTFGYINNSMGSSSWGGMINGYGPSTTNPLV